MQLVIQLSNAHVPTVGLLGVVVAHGEVGKCLKLLFHPLAVHASILGGCHAAVYQQSKNTQATCFLVACGAALHVLRFWSSPRSGKLASTSGSAGTARLGEADREAAWPC